MSGMGMLDAFGVPEFYVTHVGAIESADNGNVRIIRCIKRGGVLLPVFSLVSPLISIILATAEVRDVAQELFNSEQERLVAGARH